METTTTKTIYVVTSGEYSDYSINAMFSRCEDAQNYIDFSGSRHDIEEWPLDHYAGCKNVEVYRSQINLCTGAMNRMASSVWMDRDLITRGTVSYVIDTCRNTDSYSAYAESTVNQEHADKLAVEARQKWLRENAVKFDEWRTAQAHPVNQDPYYWSRE